MGLQGLTVESGTAFDKGPPGSQPYVRGEWVQKDHKTADRPRPPDYDQDPPDEAPETPTNEPKPTPVQDPPAEPDPAPYVVRGH